MDYFLKLRHFSCARFAMMSLNCVKYDWNDHFEKENAAKCNVQRKSVIKAT